MRKLKDVDRFVCYMMTTPIDEAGALLLALQALIDARRGVEKPAVPKRRERKVKATEEQGA